MALGVKPIASLVAHVVMVDYSPAEIAGNPA
jgi:hypothetical protein